MEVTLTRNGYNLQRRKMYLQNPRNNLRSSVELMWEQSLGAHPNSLQRQKEKSSEMIKQSYTKAIDKRLQQELKLNKSSFRVMMAPPTEFNNNSAIYNRNHSERKNSYYDSLNKQVEHLDEQKSSIQYESPPRGHQRSNSMSKAVFGYEIDRTAFKNQSYLSKILSNRLEPYLNKSGQGVQRHGSFTINHPISLQY